jgi:choline transport protein
MLFSLTDQETVFGTSSGLAIVELFYQTTNSRAGATVMSVMLGVCFINGTMGSMTSASRLLFAMARDKGMIFPSM